MSWLAKSVIGNHAQTVGASETDFIISDAFKITSAGAKTIRVDVALGKVTDGDSSSVIELAHKSGFNAWSDTKSQATSGSTTNKALTPDFTTGIITSNAHGFVLNSAVVLNGVAVMAGLVSGVVYYVRKIDANTFYLTATPDGDILEFTDDGNTVTATLVTYIGLTLNIEVAGDQGYLPLRQQGRVTLTTGAGDSVQVLDVFVTQED